MGIFALMKFYFFYSVILLSTVAFSQPKFTLSGKVTEESSKKKVAGATVKMVGSDNTSLETKTDSSGNYFFGTNVIKPNTSYVVSTHALDVRSIDFPDGILGNPKAKLTTIGADSSVNFKQDFLLKRRLACGYFRLPLLSFSKNSDSITTSSKNDLDYLCKIMEENPNFTFEIAAHSSYDETNALQLSAKRAKKVFDYLLAKGIDGGRLSPSAYGGTKSFVLNANDSLPSEKVVPSGTTLSKKWIEANYPEEKSKKDHEYLLQKNRRVVFAVLRKDYFPAKDTNKTLAPTIDKSKEKEIIDWDE